MAGGRPRKRAATLTGHWGKEQKVKRGIEESRIGAKRDGLAKGARNLRFYDDTAKAEYKRIIKEAEAVELLDNLDLVYIKMYADAYAMYEEALENISLCKEDEEMDMDKYGRLYDRAVKTIMQCSTKLGLATTDRLKLIVPKEEAPVNRFLKYVN